MLAAELSAKSAAKLIVSSDDSTYLKFLQESAQICRITSRSNIREKKQILRA